MKSKSFDLKGSTVDKGKPNKTFDFVGLYKSAAETNVTSTEKQISNESASKEKKIRPFSSKKKNKNPVLDASYAANASDVLDASEASGSLGSTAGITSTPNASAKGKIQIPKVRSIMKNSSVVDEVSIEDPMDYTPNFKTKKRNKSVSFMLEENDEVAIKRTKSEETVRLDKKVEKSKTKLDKKKLKNMQKKRQEEKENSELNMEIDKRVLKKNEEVDKKFKKKHEKPLISNPDATEEFESINKKERKTRIKELKKRKKEESSDIAETENFNDETSRPKIKKMKKKRHSKIPTAETTGSDDEIETNTADQEPKADVIAEDLENLSIGDNAHTLTNLLDEMTVEDKTKKKKNKKRKKDKKPASVSSSETADLEKIEEGKEKIKWKNRKWNKDRKGDIDEANLATSVIIENLPLKMMLSYKKLLADHFGSFGLIKKIGIAEAYPAHEPKPVFTTTIQFHSEDAANKALEEDNTLFEGSRIRVKRPLPPTQTTLVVRSYANLTEQALTSAFTCAGKIRNIRHLVKGKKAMTTAFVVFDGPEAVEVAMKKAADAKIGGKKIHVAKFEKRGVKHKRLAKRSHTESENEGDSEESND